jgi:E3 ubiquitin-protein ligase HUWE1
LHREVQDYPSKNKTTTGAYDEESASNAPGVVDKSGKLFDNCRTTGVDASDKHQDLRLPAMLMLTSKTANQHFLLPILKDIIQLRDATKKEQIDAQAHFDAELHTLTRRLDSLRHSLRSLLPTNNTTNTDGQQPASEVLQPIDELTNRLEHMSTRLSSVLKTNGAAHPQQQLFAQPETIIDVQDIRRLIQQLETTVEEFNKSLLSAAMASRINDILQIIPLAPTTDETMEIDKSALPIAPPQAKLSDVLSIDDMWDSLDECLSGLAKLPDPHAVLVLQPAVEAFFIVHTTDGQNESGKLNKKDRETSEALSHSECFGPEATGASTDGGAQSEPVVAPASRSETTALTSTASVLTIVPRTEPATIELSPDVQKILKFARTHRTVLNQILRQSTQHLSDGPFHIFTDYSSILDFDVKRKYFRTELNRIKDTTGDEVQAVHVRRNNVFEDSYRELRQCSSEDWKHRFYIAFDDEDCQDAVGLLREWYSLITGSMFDPNYALFMLSRGDGVTYTPNPLSHCNTNHTQYFKFIGRIIAKAIFDNQYMGCYFTRPFYKHILDIPVYYTDMESIDLELYKHLIMLLENDLPVLGLDLTFSLDHSEFGVKKSVELIANGASITVTNVNKHEYVRLVCQERIIDSIRPQINSFLEGFYNIIPKSLISIFNEQELELLISGKLLVSRSRNY